MNRNRVVGRFFARVSHAPSWRAHRKKVTMKDCHDQVVTVRGPVTPTALGAVLMHEHLHSDMYHWDTDEFVTNEAPVTPERRAYLLREAAPHLQQLHAFGCHAYVKVTPEPWRAWPTVHQDVSDATHAIGHPSDIRTAMGR